MEIDHMLWLAFMSGETRICACDMYVFRLYNMYICSRRYQP